MQLWVVQLWVDRPEPVRIALCEAGLAVQPLPFQQLHLLHCIREDTVSHQSWEQPVLQANFETKHDDL